MKMNDWIVKSNLDRTTSTGIYQHLSYLDLMDFLLDFQVMGFGLWILFRSRRISNTPSVNICQHFSSWVPWIIGVFMVYISSLGISQSWGFLGIEIRVLDDRQKRSVSYPVSFPCFSFSFHVSFFFFNVFIVYVYTLISPIFHFTPHSSRNKCGKG